MWVWGLKERGCESWNPQVFRRDPAELGSAFGGEDATWLAGVSGLLLRGGAPELGPRAKGCWLATATVSWLGVGGLMRLVWGGWGENWRLELVTTVRVKSILGQG